MADAPSQHLRLDAAHAAFIQGGVSVVVSARNDQLVADVLRGCGCRVSRDRRKVTVLVERERVGDVLDDVRANGSIAVVFSQPSTHRTLQVKGTDATVADGTAADLRTSRRHLESWMADMRTLGYEDTLIRAVRGEGTSLVSITFSVDAVFEQTPGPAAGQRLAS